MKHRIDEKKFFSIKSGGDNALTSASLKGLVMIINNLVALYQPNRNDEPTCRIVLTQSAFGKATRFLKDLFDKVIFIEKGNRKQFVEPMINIEFSRIFKPIIDDFEINFDLTTRLANLCTLICDAVPYRKQTPIGYIRKKKDAILVHGEKISVDIVSAILTKCHINHIKLDASKCVYSDGEYGNANPLVEKTKKAIYDELEKCSPIPPVILIAGYISVYEDAEGNLQDTTFGDNGSDLTGLLMSEIFQTNQLCAYKSTRLCKNFGTENEEVIYLIDYGDAIVLSKQAEALQLSQPLQEKALVFAEKNNIVIEIYQLRFPNEKPTVIRKIEKEKVVE